MVYRLFLILAVGSLVIQSCSSTSQEEDSFPAEVRKSLSDSINSTSFSRYILLKGVDKEGSIETINAWNNDQGTKHEFDLGRIDEDWLIIRIPDSYDGVPYEVLYLMTYHFNFKSHNNEGDIGMAVFIDKEGKNSFVSIIDHLTNAYTDKGEYCESPSIMKKGERFFVSNCTWEYFEPRRKLIKSYEEYIAMAGISEKDLLNKKFKYKKVKIK